MAFAAPSCGGDDGVKGGITIAETDDTPPLVGLLVDPEFGENVAVGSGGPNEATTIHRRTGKVTFLVSGKDSESGVRRLEIWMTATITRCEAGGLCETQNPGLVTEPRFAPPDEPMKNPGDQTSETSLFASVLQVEPEVGPGMPPPGGSRTVKFDFWATGENHHGRKARTANASVSLRENG
jgi:hypothetical protein